LYFTLFYHHFDKTDLVSNDNTTAMADRRCNLSVYGLLNDVTFHMAKCCAEVRISFALSYDLFIFIGFIRLVISYGLRL